jgi:hypothetical protein
VHISAIYHRGTDLMSWADQKAAGRINDIRNYDDKLIYAVSGTLKNYEAYKLLIDTSCRFYKAVVKEVSKDIDA